MHVGGLTHGLRRDHLGLRAPGAEEEEPVAGPRAELCRIVQHALGRPVHVRMGGRELSRRLIGNPCRSQRFSVELDRDRRLGHRDEPLAELREVDVGVVGELRREHRADPLEERAAWVRRELRVGDPALVARRAVGAALEEAIRVGNLAAREREAVQHREAVDPMVHGAVADHPLGRAGANQRSPEPGRKLAPHGEAVEMRLLLERIEAAAGVGEGGSVRDRAHHAS